MNQNLFFLCVFRAGALLYLFFCSKSDLRDRRIRPLFSLILSGVSIPAALLSGALSPADLAKTFIGCGLLFLISFASHSSIGPGDCFVILACASLVGPSDEFVCFLAGLLFCAVWSLILLLRKRVSRKDTLPFLPFLFTGHMAVFAAEAFLTAQAASAVR